jgi:hypothetical protein
MRDSLINHVMSMLSQVLVIVGDFSVRICLCLVELIYSLGCNVLASRTRSPRVLLGCLHLISIQKHGSEANNKVT